MTTPTQGEHAHPEALDDLYLKLHGLSKRLEGSGRIDESDAPEAYPAILDAMNLVRRLQCESAQVAALTAAPQGGAYAELPAGWPARFRCDSCDGNGEIGELISMGHFQPPERERCPDCKGRGWCSENPAFSADDMRDFADRTHAKRASHGQAPAGADLAFMLKTARLLAELHGETTLSEQQCAKHMGMDLVSWRRLEDCFSGGVFMPEGGGAELPREDSESVLREALGFAPAPTAQPAPAAQGDAEDAALWRRMVQAGLDGDSALEQAILADEHPEPRTVDEVRALVKRAIAVVDAALAQKEGK